MDHAFVPHTPQEPDADDEVVLPAAEALLAGTLALMTGYAEHRPPAPPTPGEPPVDCAGRHLLAAKVASNLFFLSEHPLLSPAFRSTLWRLRAHWQTLERCAALPPPAAAARAPAFWLDGPPTRH